MSNRAELSEIADAIEAMLPRFTRSSQSLDMSEQDRRDYEQYVLELKVLLDEEFRYANEYSLNLVKTANYGVSNFIGTPSYHSLERVVGIIRAAIKHIDRTERRRPEPRTIPASDRYVSINDNALGAIQADLKQLRRPIETLNSCDEEDKLIALSEIAAFEKTIAQPRVSSDLIQRFVDGILAWITRKFSAAAIAEIVQRLIAALIKSIAQT